MKTVELLRYIKGYVEFNAVGGFAERFINLCAANSIYIFNSSYQNSTLSGAIDFRTFKRLRRIARKTGVRIIVKNKRGLPFFLKEKSYRVGILIGAVAYCIFIVIMNMFVWNIDASGSEKFSNEQLIEAAERVGVKYGISRFFFDENKAARDIYRFFNGELSWVTVNIKASKCFIEVRDNDVSVKEEEKNNEPSNLIADFDGVITSDETFNGVKSIGKGSAVKKGDLLISGVLEDDYGSAIYYSAEGKFTARHNRFFQGTLPKDVSYFKFTSCSPNLIFHFFGLPVKIGSAVGSEDADIFVSKKFLQYYGQKLPIGISVLTHASRKELTLSKEELYILTVDLFTAKSYSELSNTNILSENIRVQAEKNTFSIIGEYDCIDFIGISSPIIVENNERG